MSRTCSIVVTFWQFICCLCILGCTVGPDYTAPQLPLPQTWLSSLQQPALPNKAALAEYWRLLNDPILNRLIKQATTDNPRLQEAAHRIYEARALYGFERSNYFPDIDLTADARKRRRSEAVASAISDPNNDLLALGGSLSWEIDILGRVRRLNEAATARMQASVEDFHAVRVSLQAEIAGAYIRLRTFDEQIRLTHKNIQSQRESLTLARELVIAGVTPELDRAQAESNLGQTEAALPSLRIARAKELSALAVLLGEYPDSLQKVLQQPKPIPQVQEFDRQQVPLDILRQRPDLRAAERNLAAQHARIGAREAELYPIVSFPGSFSFEALNTLEDAFQRDSLAYSIGPSIRWNFLQFGKIRSQIAAEDARYNQLLKQYEQNVLQAVKEVEDALLTQREERRRTAHLQRSVEASRTSAELVKTLYAGGLSDFQNVLDTERRLFEREISLAQSKGNSVEAMVSLFRSLGGGWQRPQRDSDSN